LSGSSAFFSAGMNAFVISYLSEARRKLLKLKRWQLCGYAKGIFPSPIVLSHADNHLCA